MVVVRVCVSVCLGCHVYAVCRTPSKRMCVAQEGVQRSQDGTAEMRVLADLGC